MILVQSLTFPQTPNEEQSLELEACLGTSKNSNLFIATLYLCCSFSFFWSHNFIYAFLSLTDHSKAPDDMDIDNIIVSFSNIASPSKQNPTEIANEKTDVELQSLVTSRHGECSYFVIFLRLCKQKNI